MSALSVSFFTYGVTTGISLFVAAIVWGMGRFFERFSKHAPEKELHANLTHSIETVESAHHEGEIVAAISAAVLASQSAAKVGK